MVAICLEVVTADEGDAGQHRQTVQAWLDNHAEVLTDQRVHLSRLGSADGITPHLRGRFRFDSELETVAGLRQDIKQWLNNNFSWWRVRYHDCSHDAADPAPCEWQQQWSKGTVPGDV